MATNRSFVPSMLFLATVMKWQTKKATGSKRVRDTTNGTQYLLNTNRVDGIRAMTDTTYSSLYYFDNPFDRQESPGYMEVALTVAQLKTQIDTTPTKTYMTISVYPKMDSSKSTSDITIPIDNFSSAVAVADSGSATDSILVYVEDGFRLVRVRVAHTLAALLAMIA
jgi:hypothetical protein